MMNAYRKRTHIMIKAKIFSFITTTILSCVLFGSVALAEAVHITYGYHPYWTGGWNGVIIKHKELWKKHLPEGSTVTFEAHLTGPPMVNALLADLEHAAGVQADGLAEPGMEAMGGAK